MLQQILGKISETNRHLLAILKQTTQSLNRNVLMINYSCMPNLQQIISNLNKILAEKDDTAKTTTNTMTNNCTGDKIKRAH